MFFDFIIKFLGYFLFYFIILKLFFIFIELIKNIVKLFKSNKLKKMLSDDKIKDTIYGKMTEKEKEEMKKTGKATTSFKIDLNTLDIEEQKMDK